MNTNKYIAWCSVVIAIEIGLFILILQSDLRHIQTSSPVEEMYNKILVTTIDSILDARFGACCCEEVIDSDDVSVPHDQFGRIIWPSSH